MSGVVVSSLGARYPSVSKARTQLVAVVSNRHIQVVVFDLVGHPTLLRVGDSHLGAVIVLYMLQQSGVACRQRKDQQDAYELEAQERHHDGDVRAPLEGYQDIHLHNQAQMKVCANSPPTTTAQQCKSDQTMSRVTMPDILCQEACKDF